MTCKRFSVLKIFQLKKVQQSSFFLFYSKYTATEKVCKRKCALTRSCVCVMEGNNYQGNQTDVGTIKRIYIEGELAIPTLGFHVTFKGRVR